VRLSTTPTTAARTAAQHRTQRSTRHAYRGCRRTMAAPTALRDPRERCRRIASPS
jgi:hypothetical protein